MDLSRELEKNIRAAIKRIGAEVTEDSEKVRRYIAAELLAVSAAIDEPGYDEVLAASALNVAMYATESAIEDADAVDRELVGQIMGGIGLAARIIAG